MSGDFYVESGGLVWGVFHSLEEAEEQIDEMPDKHRKVFNIIRHYEVRELVKIKTFLEEGDQIGE